MRDSLLGCFVYSLCGRDKDCVFVVIGEEKGYVFLADGKRRKVEAPKKKKIKHIKCVETAKIDTASPFTNGVLRRAIRCLTDSVSAAEAVRRSDET